MTDQTSIRDAVNVRAQAIQQLRLIRASERPDDVVIEVTTAEGRQHFLFPAAGLPELVQKMTTFALGTTPPATSQTATIA